jgi:class 3 adenylate cyclase
MAGAREVSILFADLQGFASFSERTSPGQVADMLNRTSNDSFRCWRTQGAMYIS